jgi:hypothetical protein
LSNAGKKEKHPPNNGLLPLVAMTIIYLLGYAVETTRVFDAFSDASS